MPLSKAVIAVVALFYAVGYWNDFFNALLYLNDSDKWPLQLVLRPVRRAGHAAGPGGHVRNASRRRRSSRWPCVVVATVPILLVYPFLQRYFTKGVLTGAVKQ